MARAAKIPHTATAVRERRSLTKAEAERLVKVAQHHRLGALIAVMLYQGLRPGEAAGLTWDCVDLRSGTLTIRQLRKLNPDGTMYLGPTKADSDRTQRLHPKKVSDRLVRTRPHRRRAPQAAAWEDNNLVFCNDIGGYIDPSNLRRDIAQLCLDARVDPITPNQLRHSAASLLVDAGVPLELVADFLGHKTARSRHRPTRHKVRPVVDLTEAQGRMLNQ